MIDAELNKEETSLRDGYERFRLSLMLFILLIASGTVGYMFFTGSSFFNALYMTIISLTTVGYEESIDMSGNTPARIFTMILLIGGAGVTVYIASILTAFLVEGELRHLLWSRRMQQQIKHLKNHVIIAGGGQTAMYAVKELQVAGEAFVLIEKNREHFERLAAQFPKTRILGVIGDATDDLILQSAGVEQASGLISTLPDDRDNLFVTISARGLNPKVRIIAKIVRQSSTRKMRMAGANEVICPDSIGGLRMASQLVRPHVVSFLDTMMLIQEEEQIRIEEIRINNPSCMGRSIAELNLPQQFGNMLVLALQQSERMKPVYNPKDTSLNQDDVLIVMGHIDWIARARDYLSAP